MLRVLIHAVLVTLVLVGVAQASPAGTTSLTLAPDRPHRAATLSIVAQGPFSTLSGLPTSALIELQHGFSASARSVAVLCSRAQAKASTCPQRSRIGAGSAQVTGSLGGVSKPVSVALTLFLGRARVSGDIASVVIAATVLGQTRGAAGRLIETHSGRYGLALRFDRLPLPTLPAGATFSLDRLALSVGSSRTVSTGRGSHRRTLRYTLIGTPPECTGSWKGELVLPFASGVLSQPLSTPCRSR